MITRSIGKVLRGKATPLQIGLACVLASSLGFVPGWGQGAGLIVALAVLLIVLNGNLAVAALVGGLAKLASLVLMPVSFQVGRLLLDGPTQGVFRKAINAPVGALMGFEYYATTGGLAMGIVFGLVSAAAIIKVVGSFRRRMATLEEGSEAYKKWAAKGWVKVLMFVFVGGGKGKATYRELAAKRVGNPIRPLGVVFVVLMAGLVYIVWTFASEPIVTALAQRGLERGNGATVDLASARLEPQTGKLVLTGLAMADPAALETDRLRAETVEADVSTEDLLRKRVTLDRVVVKEALSGEKRATPGRLLERPAPPPPPPPVEPEERGLEDYLREAEAWKKKLEQAREWMEKISERMPKDAGEGTAGPAGETLRERLKREIAEKGYARVAASHLIEGSPTVLVKELVIDGLRTPEVEGEVFDVRGLNLSTHPWLVTEAPRVTVVSRSGTIEVDVLASGISSEGGAGQVRLAYNGLPADRVSGQLKFEGEPPLKGGTVDLEAAGAFVGGTVDLPLVATLRNTTITVPGAGSQKVSELQMPIGVSGPIDRPRIRVDREAFADALVKAGAGELAGRVRGEAEKLVEKAKNEAAKKIGDEAKEKLGGALGNFLGGGGKKDEPK